MTWTRNRYDAGSCLVLCWFSVSSRLVRDRFRFRSRPTADRCAAILAAAMQLSALCLASLIVRIGFAAGLAVADWDWFVFGSLLVHFGSRFARPVVGLVSPCLVRGSLQRCFASCCWFPLLVQWVYFMAGLVAGSALLVSRLVLGWFAAASRLGWFVAAGPHTICSSFRCRLQQVMCRGWSRSRFAVDSRRLVWRWLGAGLLLVCGWPPAGLQQLSRCSADVLWPVIR